MEYKQEKKITKKGEIFIKSVCSGKGNSKIAGNNTMKLYLATDDDSELYFKANAKDRLGKAINTNEDLADALIDYYNHYATIFNIDPNILLAQSYKESNYRLYVHPGTTTASGLCQFTHGAMWDYGIMNGLNKDEIDLLSKNVEDPKLITSWVYSVEKQSTKKTKLVARKNRKVIFQNWIDNLSIAIKCQFLMMKTIAEKNNNVAASTLFSYFAGSRYKSTSYTELLRNTNNKNNGSHYVKIIFDELNKSFGYDFNKNTIDPNSFEANIG